MKRKDLIKMLHDAGYKLNRTSKHAIYEKLGSRSIQVPNHREVNEITAKAILKAAGVK